MIRYEKGKRNPNDDRALELSAILNINFNAMKHQGKKSCGTECHKAREIIEKTSKESPRQVQSYVRLTFFNFRAIENSR